MHRDSPTIRRIIEGHKARGEDPWLILASTYAKLANAEAATGTVSETTCTWLDYRLDPDTGRYVGVQCGSPDARDDFAPRNSTLWWHVTRNSRDHPHLPLCAHHIQQLDDRMAALVATGGLNVVRRYQWKQGDRVDGVPVVYYIRRTDGHIKIGFSTNLTSRMNQLRTSGPIEVLAVEGGDMKLERRRHRQFADERRDGEWFFPSPHLIAHIAGIVGVGEEPAGQTA